jgi:hypothetical protein
MGDGSGQDLRCIDARGSGGGSGPTARIGKIALQDPAGTDH